ncbi:MAG: DUF4982 domain-containing protein [Bacteroidales bacterium]|nr:DUF4982 domain-containing protein [Bacteroidales bacterium]
MVLIIILLSQPLIAQEFLQHREHFTLDKWKFYKGEYHSAENAGYIDETSWQDVVVPHTWNAQDVLTDGPRYYQGVGWYRTAFNLTRNEKSNRYFIRFEGVSQVADVFFNGNYLGTHKGGYSAFIYEITAYIRNGETNYLAVKVNNITQLDVAPSGTHLYPIFGGIYRPVTLFSTGELCISPLDYASSGVYISPVDVSESQSTIEVKTLISYNTQPIIQTRSQELLPPKGIKGTGLFGEYYSNIGFKGKPAHKRKDEEVSFDYATGSPFSDMPADGFSMIWMGRFIPARTGNYSFVLRSDDGTRLYFNDKMVIDHWGIHAAWEKTFDTTLQAGNEVSLKIEYYEAGGDASVMFGWWYQKPYDAPVNAFLAAEILDGNETVVTTGRSKISLHSNTEISETIRMQISNPHLWDAKRDPYLYKVRVSITDTAGTMLDQLEQPLGIRYFSVERDSGLILNRESYPLYGVCRHQEWRGKGPALSDQEHEKDIALIREIGANGIRFAHYQQADIMYRLCDEYGLVAWAEIPNTPSYRGGIPSYLQNCRQQLIELVKQNYNHPSILFWGLYNEIPIPAADVKLLHETVKQTDPYRLTTQADFAQPEARHYVTDVAAWNWYFGWYYGNLGDYSPWYDRLHAEHPTLAAGLSEYGAEACITQQQDPPQRPDPAGRFFPEQYQILYHETVWDEIKDRRDIWCKFIWNMFDFSWTTVTRGDKPYMNYKGLITHDRQVKKDAFYFYKANWSEDPVLHIVGKRDSVKTNPEVQVLVYTNLPEAELTVNGNRVSKKPMESDIHKITWENIVLKKGLNQITVVGISEDRIYTDHCEWEFK